MSSKKEKKRTFFFLPCAGKKLHFLWVSGLTGIYKPKQNYERDDALPVRDDEKYKYCENLKFICQNSLCKTEITIDGAFRNTVSTYLERNTKYGHFLSISRGFVVI